MKGVKLTERIRYMHCTDNDDSHGILILLGVAQWPTKAVEIYDQTDFRKFFKNFAITEQTQNELLHPSGKVPVLL